MRENIAPIAALLAVAAGPASAKVRRLHVLLGVKVVAVIVAEAEARIGHVLHIAQRLTAVGELHGRWRVGQAVLGLAQLPLPLPLEALHEFVLDRHALIRFELRSVSSRRHVQAVALRVVLRHGDGGRVCEDRGATRAQLGEQLVRCLRILTLSSCVLVRCGAIASSRWRHVRLCIRLIGCNHRMLVRCREGVPQVLRTAQREGVLHRRNDFHRLLLAMGHPQGDQTQWTLIRHVADDTIGYFTLDYFRS